MNEQITVYNVSGVIEADPGSQFLWVKYVDAQTVMDVNVAVAEQSAFDRCHLILTEERREAERSAWNRAYAAALDDAREAVAALDAYYAIEECQGNPLEKGDPEDPDPWQQGHLIERDDALAAIDALKEEQ